METFLMEISETFLMEISETFLMEMWRLDPSLDPS